jgi:NAD(P)-dependent dehydrogenase (short-subunit alcohol dehydrogenase family)
MKLLKDRVAIITGGGRGIGAAFAEAFAAHGAAVVVNDLGGAADGTGADDGPASASVQRIRDAGGDGVADGGDISDTATGERLVRTAVDTFGRLDIVVNAAGILRDRMIFNLDAADWDAVIRVHLRGHYSTVRPAAAYWRSLRNPQGNFRIINFTSLSALEGAPGQPNYAAAKMGVVGLTYSLAQGLARYGVTANAIAPGAQTRLTATMPDDKKIEFGDGARGETNNEFAPENITPLGVYLAGEGSSWLTGRVLSAAGHEVGLYPNPEPVKTIVSEGRPWDQDQFNSAIEQSFRPLADGLPRSVFASQL